jgi:hypothetical protein
MTVFGRCSIRVVVAGAGLCGVAFALSPTVEAAPWATDGYACVQTSAGAVGGAPAAPACLASAPLADMAGVPMALPGPIPAAPPIPVVPPVPPIPLIPPVPVVPLGAPLAAGAPVPAGAPLATMAGGFGGKGDPIAPPAVGSPVSGQPLLPGPS